MPHSTIHRSLRDSGAEAFCRYTAHGIAEGDLCVGAFGHGLHFSVLVGSQSLVRNAGCVTKGSVDFIRSLGLKTVDVVGNFETDTRA